MTDEEFRQRLARAERGNAVEQASLGLDLLHRRDMPRDDALAHRLLGMAHAQGVLGATVCLAYAYMEGQGVPVDRARAIALFERTAERGHWPSLLALADLQGDPERAASYLRRAVDTASEAGWDDSEEYEEAKRRLGT